MGYGYLVSSRSAVSNQSDHITDPEKFLADMKQRWPDADVSPSQSEGYALDWTIGLRGYKVIGGLQRNSDCITIDSVREHVDAAEIAVWYRSVVPPEVNLYFYTGPRWQHPVKITATTTASEIVREFTSNE